MSQFKSPKQIMLSLCEIALTNRLYISEENGTLSKEGGLYAAISANRVWRILKSSSIAPTNLHTVLTSIAIMLSRTKIMTAWRHHRLSFYLVWRYCTIYMELRVRESAVNFRFLNAEDVKDSINKPFLDFNKLARKTSYIQKSNCAYFLVGFSWKRDCWFCMGARIL